ncbi:DUF4369 domain-containing protein [Salinimicrobium soli]|uniref:DUF4369 domain-containing protein n=1 Tax=Salinimicrobium soli TaxID=1254399 RepID=UPI003AAAB8BC
MKKFGLLLVVLLLLAACSQEEKNLSIDGRVQGLKKGTLYLQKIEDTSLVTLDSVIVDGEETFNFETFIDGPQILYLYLNKKDNDEFDDRFLFFAEPGEMVVNTTLKNFETDAVVEGSENQKKLVEYRKMMQNINDRNLELIQKNLMAQKDKNEALIDSTARAYDDLLKRRYLYTVNYAMNNKDYEVAPYLAISEIFDANIKYLDTIYTSLSPQVKESKYGKSLRDYLQERKAEENSAAAN